MPSNAFRSFVQSLEEEPLTAAARQARKTARAAKGAATAAVRRVGDSLAAVSLRFYSSTEIPFPTVAPEHLVAAWQKLAKAESLVLKQQRRQLCRDTLVGWHCLPFSARLQLLEAWGMLAQRFPLSFMMPRPVLRAMITCLWRQGGAALLPDLNRAATCLCRLAKLDGGRLADLASSALDAVIYHAATLVELDYDMGAEMGPIISAEAFASRRSSTRDRLHTLSSGAYDDHFWAWASIEGRISWYRNFVGYDPVTAKYRVAQDLASKGGVLDDVTAAFIKAQAQGRRLTFDKEEGQGPAQPTAEPQEWRIKAAQQPLQE